MADHPLGPYTFKGNYIPKFEGQAGTNHGSIVKYQDKWIAFHHSAIVSGGKSEVRSLMADWLLYNTDGTIKPIFPSKDGISLGIKPTSTILLEAENGKAAGGKLAGTQVETSTKDFSGKGYVTGFDIRQDYVQVLAQVGYDMKARLKVRLSADADFAADIMVWPNMLDGWSGTKLKKTNSWEDIDLGEVQLHQGDNLIKFTSHNNVNLKIDYFLVKPLN